MPDIARSTEHIISKHGDRYSTRPIQPGDNVTWLTFVQRTGSRVCPRCGGTLAEYASTTAGITVCDACHFGAWAADGGRGLQGRRFRTAATAAGRV